MDAATFWNTTPREFWRFIAGARAARRDRERHELGLAYLNAAWQRADKLPRWATVVKGITGDTVAKTKPLTPAESRAKMRRAFAHVGFITKGEA